MSAFTLRMTIGAPTHLPLSRREVVDQIDMLISILDRLDGDPDLEDDGSTEPSLGWTKTQYFAGSDDLEEDRDVF